MKIRFTKNLNIEKKDYADIKEYKFDKKTNIVPKTKNRLLCILLGEDKGVYFIIRKVNIKKQLLNAMDSFIFKGGMYIIDNESIFLSQNGTRVSVYMEGVSTPLKLNNIERKTELIDYIDLYGNKQQSTVNRIKGLKFDSKILNTFANRKFAENFTVQPVDKFQFIMLILGIVSIILLIANIGVSYYFT